MSKRILVTPRSLTREGHPALRRLQDAGYELVFSSPGQQPSEEELLRLLPGCVGYLCGVEKVSATVLNAANQLRVISRNGTGVDNIDLAAAQQRQVRICRAEGANAIAAIKKGVYLVNTARAGLLDNDAVLAALDTGHIAGLATDVFPEEPPRDLRLVQHPKVIATPHLGGFTPESISRAVEVAVENLLAALNNDQTQT